MTIKAIPTRYAGHLFRSRLEADYACTFDSIGIAWQYETEGFELSNGMLYLPDFYLPQIRAWVEVKGDHLQRVDKFEAFAEELWADAEADEHGEKNTTDPRNPLCILATAGHHLVKDGYASIYGVRGRGSGYSVVFSPCPSCDETTIHPLWAAACRVCRRTCSTDDWMDAYFGRPFTNWPMLELRRAPRPRWHPPTGNAA